MNVVSLTLSVGLTATLLSLPFGIAAAWIIERTRFKGRGLLQILVMMPLVLPPVVTGYLLLWFFSPRGYVGQILSFLHLPVAFHWLGAVVAASVVGFPLLVMNVMLAMKSIDSRLEIMSQTLGRGAWSTFWKVTLPLSWPGILSGALLSFARGLGEFGATIVLAGRIPGETETISLAIYAALDRPDSNQEIRSLVIVSIVICAVCVFASRYLDRRYVRRLEMER